MQLTTGTRQIWLIDGAVDFRKSIDGLSSIVENDLGANPCEGIFIFHNHLRNRVKILIWHGNGFMLIYKRFEKGKLTIKKNVDDQKTLLNREQLNWLLKGVDWLTLSGKNDCNFDHFS